MSDNTKRPAIEYGSSRRQPLPESLPEWADPLIAETAVRPQKTAERQKTTAAPPRKPQSRSRRKNTAILRPPALIAVTIGLIAALLTGYFGAAACAVLALATLVTARRERMRQTEEQFPRPSTAAMGPISKLLLALILLGAAVHFLVTPGYPSFMELMPDIYK